jgi:hypothetical protein
MFSGLAVRARQGAGASGRVGPRGELSPVTPTAAAEPGRRPRPSRRVATRARLVCSSGRRRPGVVHRAIGIVAASQVRSLMWKAKRPDRHSPGAARSIPARPESQSALATGIGVGSLQSPWGRAGGSVRSDTKTGFEDVCDSDNLAMSKAARMTGVRFGPARRPGTAARYWSERLRDARNPPAHAGLKRAPSPSGLAYGVESRDIRVGMARPSE